MKGRKPVPSRILQLRGSARAPKGTPNELAGTMTEAPTAPLWMEKQAREKWSELAPLLVQRGVLNDTDLDRLQDYCVAYARWRKSERKLITGGEVVTHSNGVEGLNHWLRVADIALSRMDKAGCLLGLSPVDRARIKSEPPRSTGKAGMSAFFG